MPTQAYPVDVFIERCARLRKKLHDRLVIRCLVHFLAKVNETSHWTLWQGGSASWLHMSQISFQRLPCKGISSSCGWEQDTHVNSFPVARLKMLLHDGFPGDSSQYFFILITEELSTGATMACALSRCAWKASLLWFCWRPLWAPCLVHLVDGAICDDENLLPFSCMSVSACSAIWQRCVVGLATQYIRMLSGTCRVVPPQWLIWCAARKARHRTLEPYLWELP